MTYQVWVTDHDDQVGGDRVVERDTLEDVNKLLRELRIAYADAVGTPPHYYNVEVYFDNTAMEVMTFRIVNRNEYEVVGVTVTD